MTVMTSCETIEDFKRYIDMVVSGAMLNNDCTGSYIAVDVIVGYELLPNTIMGNGWFAMRDDVRTERTDDSIKVIATYLVKRKGGG